MIAGGVLSETVVGAAVFWSMAALECKNVVDGWKQMNIQNSVRLVHGGILDIVGTNGFSGVPFACRLRSPRSMNVTENYPQFSADPDKNRARRALLLKLAVNTRNHSAAELARELLAGNVNSRRVIESQLYADVFEGATRDFSSWYGGLSEAEKDAEAAKGEQAMKELADDEMPAGPTREQSSKRPTSRWRGGDDDYVEDFSDRNWIDE